jgi:hypothetical protein
MEKRKEGKEEGKDEKKKEKFVPSHLAAPQSRGKHVPFFPLGTLLLLGLWAYASWKVLNS